MARRTQNRVFVAGVGMTKFEKPGRREWDYPDMLRESGTKALADAGVDYADIEEAYVGGSTATRPPASGPSTSSGSPESGHQRQ